LKNYAKDHGFSPSLDQSDLAKNVDKAGNLSLFFQKKQKNLIISI